MTAELSPLEIRNASLNGDPVVPAPPVGRGRAATVFSGMGWIVDRQRSIECRVEPRAHRLRIGGVGSFWVTADGSSLGCSRMDPGSDPNLGRLALLGPAMTLALALQGIFCLHASGVEVASGVLAFAGESGAGKSTLARILIESSVLGRRRAADDILPIDLAAGQPMARSDFPQLKLPSGEQPYLTGPSSLPLRAVFLLQPPRAAGTVRVEKVAARHSALALIRHTVAARLFDARLLERHLHFFAAVAERIPVCRLSYPWRPDSLPLVAEALAADHG